MKNIKISSILISFFVLNACSSHKTEVAKDNSTPVVDHNAVKVQAPQTVHHAEEIVGVDPDKALGWLKNGNARFRKNRLRKDGQSMADIERLSKGQKPHTIILSCSDSRVPPELIFDQKLGELFVVRTAGESSDYSAIASIEYAVEHLGTKLIVVMGHTHCGAVKAAINTPVNSSAGSEHLDHLVSEIRPRVGGIPSQASTDVALESWNNANGAAKNLTDRSEILRKREAEGRIKIVSALYYLADGKVSFQQPGMNNNEEARQPVASTSSNH